MRRKSVVQISGGQIRHYAKCMDTANSLMLQCYLDLVTVSAVLGDDFIFGLSLFLIVLYCNICIGFNNVIDIYCSCPAIKMITTNTTMAKLFMHMLSLCAGGL